MVKLIIEGGGYPELDSELRKCELPEILSLNS